MLKIFKNIMFFKKKTDNKESQFKEPNKECVLNTDIPCPYIDCEYCRFYKELDSYK